MKSVIPIWFKMSYLSKRRSCRGVCFWLENVPKETLFTRPVLKLLKNFVHGENVHPSHCIPKWLNENIYLRKTVQIFIYMLTWHFKKCKPKINTTTHCYHGPFHSPCHSFYLVSIFYKFINQNSPTTIL